MTWADDLAQLHEGVQECFQCFGTYRSVAGGAGRTVSVNKRRLEAEIGDEGNGEVLAFEWEIEVYRSEVDNPQYRDTFEIEEAGVMGTYEVHVRLPVQSDVVWRLGVALC